MQTRVRSEIDADLNENYVSISDYKTERNSHEINCVECNKTFYADKEEYEKMSRVVRQGLDNPFLCDDCRMEYDDLERER